MLNCCVEKKISRESGVNRQCQRTDPEVMVEEEVEEEEESDEEFFECDEDPAEGNVKPSRSLWNQPEGRLRQCNNLTLLETEERLYIPMTQEPAPMTEDMLEEHAEVLLRLGTDAEGSKLRARMMSASLLSDMESFKAANPGALLEDFVRWYSPRDWTPTEDASGHGMKGQLSTRMQLPGNLWVDVWQSAKPVPARRQRRLFDDTREAEKILHYLADLVPGAAAAALLPCLVHAAILRLADQVFPCQIHREVLPLLEKVASRAADVSRSPQVTKYEEVLELLTTAERLASRVLSLRHKFVGTSNSDVETEDRKGLHEFVSQLMGQPEVTVEGASGGRLGKTIHRLFAEAEKSANMLLDDLPPSSRFTQPSQFPRPVGREYILRVTAPRPAPYSRPSPQRMYCVLTKEDFRLAGAFCEDTVFV